MLSPQRPPALTYVALPLARTTLTAINAHGMNGGDGDQSEEGREDIPRAGTDGSDDLGFAPEFAATSPEPSRGPWGPTLPEAPPASPAPLSSSLEVTMMRSLDISKPPGRGAALAPITEGGGGGVAGGSPLRPVSAAGLPGFRGFGGSILKEPPVADARGAASPGDGAEGGAS
eukprot:9151155-Pyramimonas_sp.AAC.1